MQRWMSALAAFGWLSAAMPLAADEPTRPAAEARPAAAPLMPLPLSNGAAKLAPSNTRITFVGLHEGDDPKPRLGGFAQFTGQVEVDAEGQLQRITLEIETRSLWTEIDRLTNHLKSPDFFAVREHPTASFRSTGVAPAGERDGVRSYLLRGELTLLGETRPIEFPVKVESGPQGLTLLSDFLFDRREFGMTYGQGQVKNQVAVKVRVGEPTVSPAGRSGG